VNGLALNSDFAFRLVFIKLLSTSGDGEIRTLDPLLARQVLSQLSYTPMILDVSLPYIGNPCILFSLVVF
jgi:hypothetical protein